MRGDWRRATALAVKHGQIELAEPLRVLRCSFRQRGRRSVTREALAERAESERGADRARLCGARPLRWARRALHCGVPTDPLARRERVARVM